MKRQAKALCIYIYFREARQMTTSIKIFRKVKIRYAMAVRSQAKRRPKRDVFNRKSLWKKMRNFINGYDSRRHGLSRLFTHGALGIVVLTLCHIKHRKQIGLKNPSLDPKLVLLILSVHFQSHCLREIMERIRYPNPIPKLLARRFIIHKSNGYEWTGQSGIYNYRWTERWDHKKTLGVIFSHYEPRYSQIAVM